MALTSQERVAIMDRQIDEGMKAIEDAKVLHQKKGTPWTDRMTAQLFYHVGRKSVEDVPLR